MFKTDLNLVEVNGAPDLWWFGAPLIWEEPGLRITVPAGFITDLASIPHWLDWIPFLDRTGNSRRPAAVHDALYAMGRDHGKDFADAFLREALLAEGLSGFQAWCYWAAVHYFGASSYQGDGAPGHKDFIADAYAGKYMVAGATLFV